MMNEFNPDGKDIRFIDSHYRDLFRIPDGGTIQVHYSDDSVVIKPCKFIDEYHTQIGNNVFHICQFAELLERNGSYCQAEPEIMGDEAAWQVGRDQYLAIQTCEDGYDYTLFDKEFHEIDGGQLDNPELSMLEARAEILAGFGLQMRELRVQVYEEVMEKAEAVEAVNASLLDLAKQIDQFSDEYDHYEYADRVDDKKSNIVEIYHDSIGFQELQGFMKPENYLKNAEMAMEDDYGMLDGVINNGKAPATEERSSVLAQLKEQPVLDSPHKPPKARTEREME